MHSTLSKPPALHSGLVSNCKHFTSLTYIIQKTQEINGQRECEVRNWIYYIRKVTDC